MAAAKKSVAKAPAKDKKNVSTVNEDPLADLGLPETKTATAVVAPPVAPIEATASDEVEVGEIEFGFVEFIPTAKRKAEGSKYKFAQLPAPAVWTDGANKGKPKIASFTVKLQPGVDADKLRRSVQSATTQANRQGSDEGKYFVSRSVNDAAGKFAGMQVFRTDAKPTK